MIACCRCRSLVRLIYSECTDVDPRTRSRTTPRVVHISTTSTVERDLTEPPQRVPSRGWTEGIAEEIERSNTGSDTRPLTEQADN